MIWIHFLLFAIGVLLVVKGGDFFVDAASFIAKSSGIPQFIIGATIVSVATTLPEMIVSIIAAAEGKIDMAVGNAIGSVTANTGIILAIAMIFLIIIIRREDYIVQCLLLISSAIVLILGSIGGFLATWSCIVLALFFILFVIINVKKAKSEIAVAEKSKYTGKEFWINILKFVLGAIGIVGGSQLLVSNGSEIAVFFGIPERVIAVTMVAIGTSLPELVTTITAITKKRASLSIGNIIGANLIDLSLILPICALVSGKALPIPHQTMTIDLPVCLGLITLAIVPLLIKKKSSRIIGFLMFAVYCAYIVIVI
ncbi:MAG: calcium/sodium antiporter [Clostridia bacterium]